MSRGEILLNTVVADEKAYPSENIMLNYILDVT